MFFIPTLKSSFVFASSESDPEPANINGMILWVDASDVTGSANHGYITTWPDKSLLVNNITASSITGFAPVYRSNMINSLPAVQFDSGSFEFAPFTRFSSSAEMFMVLRSQTDPRGAANIHGPHSFGALDAVGDCAIPYQDGHIYEPFHDASVPGQAGTVTKTVSLSSSFRIYNVNASASYKCIRYQGEIIWSGDINSCSFGVVSHSLGHGRSGVAWSGWIAEMMVYSHSLSAAERNETAQYLSDKYNLPLIEDSSSFSPSTLGGMIANWDVSALTGYSDTDPIHGIPDTSVWVNHLTQSSGVLRPLYMTNLYMGKPAARFTSGQGFNMTNAVLFPGTGSITAIVVCKPSTDCTPISHTVDNPQFRLRRAGSNIMSFYGSVVPEVTAGNHKPIGTWQAFAWTRDGSTTGVTLWQNGIQDSVGGGNGGTFSINRVGPNPHGIPFVGDIGEIIIYDNVKTPMELIKLYDLYLREKWGLPGT